MGTILYVEVGGPAHLYASDMPAGAMAVGVVRLVESLGIDLVIVGHRRSKKFALRWWRGSVDSLLMERVHCSILVAGDRPTA